jgi:hypothetical protein
VLSNPLADVIAATLAKRHLDRAEVPPDGLEHNFGRRRVYWLDI